MLGVRTYLRSLYINIRAVVGEKGNTVFILSDKNRVDKPFIFGVLLLFQGVCHR